MSANFDMHTTRIVELRHGVYWEADLLMDGVVIGTIIQHGNGGADQVLIANRDNSEAWDDYCASNGGQERALYDMLVRECQLTTEGSTSC